MQFAQYVSAEPLSTLKSISILYKLLKLFSPTDPKICFEAYIEEINDLINIDTSNMIDTDTYNEFIKKYSQAISSSSTYTIHFY